jgi:hypothetical protein
VPFTDLRIYGARKGEEMYEQCFKIRHVIPHRYYNGNVSCFDIALLFFDKEDDQLGKRNYILEEYGKKSKAKVDSVLFRVG